jgi:hypothetical protein
MKSTRRPETEKNRRLDAFLTELQIEREKKEKIINYVEDLTFDVLKQKSQPKLRLRKPPQRL